MVTRTVDDIPTLSQLYRDTNSPLSAAASKSTSSSFTPDGSLNDRIGLVQGDITKLKLDAIVNAANRRLLGGAGVDGAIHAAAGPELAKECRPLGPIETGDAVITKGYNLPSKHVIHTVGPVYGMNDTPEESLARCYHESLKVAANNGVKTVGFSAISTGVYGFPNESAAEIACQTVREFLESGEGSNLSRVVFVTFMPVDVKAYDKTIPKIFPPAN